MLSNKKLNPIVFELFIRWAFLLLLSRHPTLLSQLFYTLLYYENPKQTRTSTNCI